MNNTLSKIFIFAAGAAIGSAVTWKLVKTKYEQIANEEIESVKEAFSRGNRVKAKPVDDACEIPKNDIRTAVDIRKGEAYAPYNEEEEGDEEDLDNPRIIPPEELGEDYEVESLNYYADGVLADDDGNIIKEEDYAGLVGEDFASHFGEYEDDSVFVRNDRLKTDYEILMDYRAYAEVYGG